VDNPRPAAADSCRRAEGLQLGRNRGSIHGVMHGRDRAGLKSAEGFDSTHCHLQLVAGVWRTPWVREGLCSQICLRIPEYHWYLCRNQQDRSGAPHTATK
jgi:hypothetical protein